MGAKSDVSCDYKRDRGLEMKLARVRRYGSHRVKVSLKNRVRSGLSEGLALGLLKIDRGLRLTTDHRPLTTGRGTRAYPYLALSLFWPTPIEQGRKTSTTHGWVSRPRSGRSDMGKLNVEFQEPPMSGSIFRSRPVW